jgi:hypothetical protein
MAEIRPIDRPATPASFVLGRKLDSIPFSGYHILIIAVLARRCRSIRFCRMTTSYRSATFEPAVQKGAAGSRKARKSCLRM